MTTRLTPWQTLTLTDGERDVLATSARGTGTMLGYWPCDTAELAALDEVERSRRSGVPVTLTELRREGGAL